MWILSESGTLINMGMVDTVYVKPLGRAMFKNELKEDGTDPEYIEVNKAMILGLSGESNIVAVIGKDAVCIGRYDNKYVKAIYEAFCRQLANVDMTEFSKYFIKKQENEKTDEQ